ncbi:glycosyltransferase family 4 protein [Alkalibacillus almallahensis]|uniref:glycosyltransferase family 4 protein n=1 Tax=Alkalibacillus almallahensis TaxID=1379154 RepID=UPI00141F2444|nr:glycosyltransferase family 4 protein [Alkalibacillus almallahensis]NIK11790.1 glycosyltransferase involved in cell wall biosynthesis [Alkalibacillus almallahensis]
MNNEKTILLFSDFPTENKPANFMFVKHRTEILKKKYNIIVVSVEVTKDESEVTCYEEENFKHYVIKLNSRIPKIRSVILDKHALKLLSYIIEEYAPSLIEVHFSSYRSWLVRKISKIYNIPYIIVEHATFFERKVKSLYYGPKIKKALLNAAKVVAVSQPLKETMNKYVNTDIEVVPNIVSTDKFKIMNDRVDNETPQLVTVGSLDLNDKKGYVDLLENLAILKQKGYDFKLKIAGNGPNKDNLINKRNELKLIDNVEFIGTINNEDLVQLFNESDFFVSTSKIETFGVAIVEAMSCGLPIVATYSGGPETFVGEQVGVLAQHSSEDIAKSIEYMLNNYRNYKRIEIRNNVIKNFSEDKYLERMKKIYDKLI